MKSKLLHIALLLGLHFSGNAQYISAYTAESNTVLFTPSVTFTDSLSGYWGSALIFLDTSGCGKWQIGNTSKPEFSPADTIFTIGIMTDTIGYYPTRANNSFIIKVDSTAPNFTVDFWHKYETDSGRDGGLVEFSLDSGATWLNVISCYSPDMNAIGFYSRYDTIFTGEYAFTGNSHGELFSSFQFINCWGLRPMSTSCFFPGGFSDPFTSYFRFRFVSDSVSDTLSGWMIDSIKFYSAQCEGGIREITHPKPPTISPIPTSSELTITTTFTTPYAITLINMLGQQVYKTTTPTQRQTIDVSRIPAGVYEVEIENEGGERYYEKAVIVH